MSLLDHGGHQERVAQRRPPPVIISEPELDSPNGPAIAGAVVPAQAVSVILVPRPKSLGLPRLPPTTAGPLSALSGPADRQPLLYTGDAFSSLTTLRQDILSSYREICGALGEPQRSDLVNGSLPPAAALGLPLPPALGPAAVRLPALPGESGFPSAPLLLPPAPSGQVAALGPPGQAGALAMGLGPDIGIEAVGSGADAGARIITPVGISWGAIGRLPAGAGVKSSNSVMGAMRSLSAGHAGPSAADGLPPLGNHWPLGRPSVSSLNSNAGKGRGGSGGGPRVAMLSGFSRPQDPESEFLGEESAVVYPPVGRSFSGGTSAAARAVSVGARGLGPGQMIDAMDDFRFRGGRSKHIKIEDLDNPSRLMPEFRRNDNMQLEVFLKVRTGTKLWVLGSKT
ncbi:hypothetical protein Vretimale_2452 [Volvox reticuliferus]|nr:hypothetical protein Vretimale_2452 [Volvox reticuliferus]